MPQPDFVPVTSSDDVRPDAEMPAPGVWTQSRPAEVLTVFAPNQKRFGHPGPDQGYGLKLAKQVAKQAKLTPGEHLQDVVSGCLAVALQRAALYGRAPVVYDLQHAFSLWGFIGNAPDELVDFRKPLFEACSHDYWDQRKIADAVPESTLRMSHTEVAASLANWQSLIHL